MRVEALELVQLDDVAAAVVHCGRGGIVLFGDGAGLHLTHCEV